MRNQVTLFAAAVLIAFAGGPASAQDRGRSLQLGLKGGATFSTIDVEDAAGVDIERLTGFGGGAFLSIPLGNLLLQPEVLYVRKGTSVSGADLEGAQIDLKLDYIEVPLLLVLPIGSGAGATPYLFGGGAIAFESGCTFGVEAAGVSLDIDCDEGDEEFDLEVLRKDVDYSAVFGGGLRIPAGSGAFLLEGRYTFGLADLNDSGDPDDEFKNRSIAAFVGYSFPLGR